MKIIAITTPMADENDLCLIRGLLDSGVETLHLRKPDADIHYCRSLLKELTWQQRNRIIIHNFAQLYGEFSLKGIHINRNIKSLPYDYKGFKTRSCHSFEEIKEYKNGYDYLFLSPIFNSISKVGYKSGFTPQELQKASADGIIDNKVIALGGVTFDSIPYLEELNFGGVAMIGGIYNFDAIEYLNKYENHYSK